MLDDSTLIARFADGGLEELSHADHVRVVYLRIQMAGPVDALAFVRDGLRRLTRELGVPARYHETMTVGWVRVVARLVEQDARVATFDEFVARHPEVLRADLLRDYYSEGLLFAPAAREAFVEPDLRSLP